LREEVDEYLFCCRAAVKSPSTIRWYRRKLSYFAGFLNAAVDRTRSKSELVLENTLLRQQAIVLNHQVKRPQLTWRDRTFFVLLSNLLRTCKQSLVIVQPDTVLRWHRELFRWVWRRRSRRKRKRGRPHQGIEQRIPRQLERCDGQFEKGKVVSRSVLGGLHHDYR